MFNTDSVANHQTADEGHNFDISKPNTRAATVVVRNTGEQNAKVQLQGAVRETYVDLGEEETIEAGEVHVFSVTDYWPRLRVVGKPAEATKQTTLWVESASVDS